MVGEDVLITGAGPIGIMAVAIARFVGARHVVITDVNDYRLGLAQKMGASRAINVTRESLDATMKDLGMQEGFDIGLEMSGNAAAFRDMLRTMHHGGSIAILGIPPGETAIDWNEVIFKGLTLKGIYGREMFETWYKMASLLQSGLNIDPIITHHFGAQEFEKGFEPWARGSPGRSFSTGRACSAFTHLGPAVCSGIPPTQSDGSLEEGPGGHVCAQDCAQSRLRGSVQRPVPASPSSSEPSPAQTPGTITILGFY